MAHIGDVVPSHFNASIVTASYFASLCGCLLTVELLHRRGTGLRNWRSWLENIVSATALGAIGIWCMHFIGNRAIILGDGTAAIQLVYNPGYSTLSVFLPIIGLTIAFGAAEAPFRSPVFHWIALTCTGIFAGLSVVGMHYIGNFGISNYRLQYVTQYLAASVVIAIGDCLAVLILFYNWRDKWISDWWKRLLCAMALAGGVSAMHFTASTNCIYHLKHYNDPDTIRSRDVQVIIAGILCGTAALIVLCVLFFTRHRSRMLKKSSQQVMLACAMFDPDGRVLVTTEGVLPSKEITEKYNHRTFDEDFDTAHPVFRWIFRVTHNWSVVSDLIPKMKGHVGVRGEDGETGSKPGSSKSSSQYESDTSGDYSIYFRERFCVAAAGLAASMHIAIDSIGVLYDKIIETGTLKPEDRVVKRNTVHQSREDLESALRHSIFGKGQLLFLTRQLDADQTDELLNAGFRLASVQQVGRNIAEAMQIPLTALEGHMESLQQYAEHATTVEKAGTWLSIFAIVPKLNSKGFDIIVKRKEQDQLPDYQLSAFEPQPWQGVLLRRIDGFSTAAAMNFLEDRDGTDVGRSDHEHHFALSVLSGFMALSKQVPSSWFQSARFVGRPVHAHYSQTSHVTYIYALVVCADLHTSTEACSDIAQVPMSFFNTRQQCYAGSPNHQVLARSIHQEFGPLLTPKGANSAATPAKKFSLHSFMPSTRRPSVTPSESARSDGEFSSDTHELVEKPRHYEVTSLDVTSGAERDNIWGGILVNSETVIQSDTKKPDAGVSTHDLGIRVAVGTSKPEATYVDELFAIARATLLSKSG